MPRGFIDARHHAFNDMLTPYEPIANDAFVAGGWRLKGKQ